MISPAATTPPRRRWGTLERGVLRAIAEVCRARKSCRGHVVSLGGAAARGSWCASEMLVACGCQAIGAPFFAWDLSRIFRYKCSLQICGITPRWRHGQRTGYTGVIADANVEPRMDASHQGTTLRRKSFSSPGLASAQPRIRPLITHTKPRLPFRRRLDPSCWRRTRYPQRANHGGAPQT